MSEHIDTSSFIKSQSPIEDYTVILEKRRPPGRSGNLRVNLGSLELKREDQVNFGEVRGASQMSAFPSTVRKHSARPSRRGKDQISL